MKNKTSGDPGSFPGLVFAVYVSSENSHHMNYVLREVWNLVPRLSLRLAKLF